MTGDIATRLRTLYDRMVVSLNFIVDEIKRVFMKEFYDVSIPESKTIGNDTYISYPIISGKVYDIDLSSTSNPMFNLGTEATLLTAECPEWHFFFTAGSDAPMWARTISGSTSEISIKWASTPTFTSGTRYEVNLMFLNKPSSSTYEGLIIEQEAAS